MAPTNYSAAARRHFADGKFLLDGERLPLADHALGIAAECALKAILVTCGARVDNFGNHLNAKGKMVHLPEILGEFRASNNPYVQDLPPSSPQELFHAWRVDDRYSDGQHILRARAEVHASAASLLLALMERALPPDQDQS